MVPFSLQQVYMGLKQLCSILGAYPTVKFPLSQSCADSSMSVAASKSDLAPPADEKSYLAESKCE